MDTAVVILAGGKGSRFWPRSQVDQPKQFLSLSPGEPTLFQATFARGERLVPCDRVFAILPESLASQALAQVPALDGQLIIEPCARDTAAALALAAQDVVQRLGPETVLIFLPADHYVPSTEAFRASVLEAAEVAAGSEDICVLGLPPVRPETAYGYIVPGQVQGRAYRVEEFVEKPPLDKAWELTTRGALWNVGVFVARAQVLLQAMETYAPAVYEATRDAVQRSVERLEHLKGVSFDVAVLERAPNVVVVKAAFPWDDVGTWSALERVVPPDSFGNVRQGEIVAENTERAILVNDDPNRQLVALGVRDIVCVSTSEGVLVAAKDRLTTLKEIFPRLRSQGALQSALPEPRSAHVVDKPWGRELWWALTEQYCAKIIEVGPGQALSRQYHEVKAESVFVVSGQGAAEVGGETVTLEAGVCFDVPPGTVHRFVAGSLGLVILEVSTSEVDDVVRLEDRYGRVAVQGQAI